MNERYYLRIGRRRLAFATVDATRTEAPVSYTSYLMKPGISVAANLREALRQEPCPLPPAPRTTILIDSPVLMVPVDLYQESDCDMLFSHSFPSRSQDSVMADVVPDLNCVALYAMSHDLRQVCDGYFQQPRYLCAAMPVWRQLHKRSFTGVRAKLYGYFHDERLEVFSFQQNRFKFYNAFDAQRTADSLYFLLYVWRQLNLQQEYDELHLVGNIPGDGEELLRELHRYLKHAYVINPAADYNRLPVTKVAGLDYDLMTLIVKGR